MFVSGCSREVGDCNDLDVKYTVIGIIKSKLSDNSWYKEIKSDISYINVSNVKTATFNKGTGEKLCSAEYSSFYKDMRIKADFLYTISYNANKSVTELAVDYASISNQYISSFEHREGYALGPDKMQTETSQAPEPEKKQPIPDKVTSPTTIAAIDALPTSENVKEPLQAVQASSKEPDVTVDGTGSSSPANSVIAPVTEKVQTETVQAPTAPINKKGDTYMLEPAPAMVQRMIEYAMHDGGLSSELEIQNIRIQLESLPKPEMGDRKSARKINDEALLFLKNNNYDSAVELLIKANKLDPSDLEIVNNLGYSLLKQRSFDLAQQALITSLIMSPGRVPAWSNLGDVFGVKGDISRSVACFSNAYRFSKNRVKTYQQMKGLNSSEDVETLKQARTIVMEWAEKSYPEIKQI